MTKKSNGGDDGDDEAVGYGKPPKHSQWKKGQSGNPSGKKKGKGLAHYLLEAGEEEKIFLVDGKEVVMPANAALAKKIYADGIKGKHQATRFAFDAQKALAGDLPSPELVLCGPEELEVARSHADWLKLIEEAEAQSTEDDLDV
jgi:hypothetical protein